jgi:mannose-6-phosphate isomerase-like protein (cupin superfamily)
MNAGKEPRMKRYETKRLPVASDAIAPDGSAVRLLPQVDRGGLADFELGPGEVATAVAHRTIEEIWYFLNGRGEMWRKLNNQESVEPIDAGVSITIPVGTHFQFRSFGHEPLSAIGVTMPPWPGEGEAYVVEGKWTPTVPRAKR